MPNMTNRKVRAALFEAGLKQYELAEILGVSEARVSTMLRREMPEETQARIVSVIEKHEAEHETR